MVEPKRKSQYANAFSRGNATSGAPICSGMMHVREAGEQRRREHQQHDRAVHREQLVVLLLGLHDLHARLEQLGADDQRHHAADAEEHERRDQVQVPDGLVVGGGDPLDDDVALALDLRRAERDALEGRAGADLWCSVALTSLLFQLRARPCRAGSVAVVLVRRAGPCWPASRSESMYSSYSASETTLTLKSMSGVVLAAELGALALVRALALGDERHVVGLARDHVLLVEEVDDPEGVDDVARLQLDLRPFLSTGRYSVGSLSWTTCPRRSGAPGRRLVDVLASTTSPLT